MKKLFVIVVSMVMLAILSISQVAAASYLLNFSMTGTSTIATSSSFYLSVANSTLASSSYMLSSGLDTQISDSGTQLPSMPTTNGTWFVDTYSGTSKNLQYTFGNAPATSFPIILGQGGYVTTADTAALEPVGNDFSIVATGYADTVAPTISGNTITSGTGTITGSPVTLTSGAVNTITDTSLGTYIVVLQANVYGYAVTSGTTITGSPVLLYPGTNTITGTGSTGTFAIYVGNFITGYGGTGVVSSNVVSLVAGGQTPTISTPGTLLVYLTNGTSAAVVSGGSCLVSGSPVQLGLGVNTVTTTGSTGTITITLTIAKNIVSKTNALVVGVDSTTSGQIDLTATAGGLGGSIGDSSGTTPVNMYSGSITRVGERFTSMVSKVRIAGLSCYLGKVGAPTGNLYINVRKSSDDSLIGTLQTIDVSTLSAITSYAPSGLSVDVGINTDIRVDFEYSSGDASNYVQLYYDNSNGYVNGVYTTYTGSSWSDNGSYDLRLAITYSSPAVTLNTVGVASGMHTITISGSASTGLLSLQVDALTPVVASYPTYIPDTANAWLINQGGIFIYLTSYVMTVSGVEKVRYCPVTMISGATLPDIDSTVNGTITFGNSCMSSGITVASGSLVPQGVTSSSGTSGINAGYNFMGTSPGGNAAAIGSGSSATSLPDYPFVQPVVQMAQANGMTGFTLSWVRGIEVLVLMLIVGTIIICWTKSMLFTGIAEVVVLTGAFAHSVTDFYVVAGVAVVLISIWVLASGRVSF